MSFQIANIWQKKEGGGGIQTLPSLRYMNNPLENCSIEFITLDYSTIDRTAGEIRWTQVGLDATVSKRSALLALDGDTDVGVVL